MSCNGCWALFSLGACNIMHSAPLPLTATSRSLKDYVRFVPAWRGTIDHSGRLRGSQSRGLARNGSQRASANHASKAKCAHEAMHQCACTKTTSTRMLQTKPNTHPTESAPMRPCTNAYAQRIPALFKCVLACANMCTLIRLHLKRVQALRRGSTNSVYKCSGR